MAEMLPRNRVERCWVDSI